MSNSKFHYLLLTVTTIGIFIYAYRPVTANDTFFGLKLGELIVNSGRLPFTEPFSWSAQGRTIIPYEWLAQVWLYFIFKAGGFAAIQIYTAAMPALTFLVAFALNRRSLKRDLASSLLLSLLLVAFLFEFFVSRPHLIAFVGFLGCLALIYHSLLRHRSTWLLLTLPLTYIWTNSHASFILSPYLIFSFAALRHSRRLFIFGLLTLLTTLLPPLWHRSYLLLWHFLTHLNVITQFIVEWGSLSLDPVAAAIYFSLAAAAAVVTVTTLRSTPRSKRLLILPLIPIILASFQAIRQIAFGAIAAITVLAILLPKFSLSKSRLFTLITSIILITSTAALFIYKRPAASPHLPKFEADMAFLKTHPLKGRMFNEFALGSYLLYYLYPEYQVFFDGRADVYLCCEIPNFQKLITAKNTSANDFSQTAGHFLDQYQFSYLIIPYAQHNPLEFTAATRMADILLDDPQWRLIYASDNLQIILKNDGLNQAMFDSGFTAITPYRSNEFRPTKASVAETEYRRLIALEDSGISRNGLGWALLAQNQVIAAKAEFSQAIRLNPQLGKPHLGLARIATSALDTPTTITHLNTTISLSPHLGEAYLMLAQLYQDQGRVAQAKSTINQGLEQNIDLLSRQKLVQLLQQLR